MKVQKPILQVRELEKKIVAARGQAHLAGLYAALKVGDGPTSTLQKLGALALEASRITGQSEVAERVQTALASVAAPPPAAAAPPLTGQAALRAERGAAIEKRDQRDREHAQSVLAQYQAMPPGPAKSAFYQANKMTLFRGATKP